MKLYLLDDGSDVGPLRLVTLDGPLTSDEEQALQDRGFTLNPVPEPKHCRSFDQLIALTGAAPTAPTADDLILRALIRSDVVTTRDASLVPALEERASDRYDYGETIVFKGEDQDGARWEIWVLNG